MQSVHILGFTEAEFPVILTRKRKVTLSDDVADHQKGTLLIIAIAVLCSRDNAGNRGTTHGAQQYQQMHAQ